MKKRPLQIFALLAVLSFVGGVAAAARHSSDKASEEKKILEEIAGYRGWTRVTAESVEVPADSASPGG